MRAATETGPVVETVSRRRVIPPAEVQKESGGHMPDFWDYIEGLSPEDWNEHIVYLYREDPKITNYPGEYAFLDKFVGTIEVRPGVSVPMQERGVIEQAIREKFGGRAFRLICKRGRERVTIGKCVNEATPKFPDQNPPNYAAPLTNASGSDQVAMKAIDAVGAKEPEALKLAMEVLQKASDVVLKGAPSAPQQSETDLALKQLLGKALEKALNPEPRPSLTEELMKFKELKELFFPAPKNAIAETLELIGALKNSGLIPGASGRGSGLIDLGRELIPLVASNVKETIHEWRLGTEAQERVVAIQRGALAGAQPIRTVNPAPTSAPAGVASSAAPENPQPAANTQSSANPPITWIETKIVEIYRDMEAGNYTLDEAVDETLSFIDRAYPALIPLLLDPPKLHPALSPGEQGLLQLFQSEPILQQIPLNPRLVEFLKKFIAAAKESEIEPPKPQETPPVN